MKVIAESEKEKKYIHKLNSEIKNLFKDVFFLNIKNFKTIFFLLKTIRNQKKAVNLRYKWEKEGIHVPPFMIFSVTNRCNLKCSGCYIKAQERPIEKEMDTNKLKEILRQARELGISIVLISGGEPFMRRDIFDITKDFSDIIFVVFTNGMLIDSNAVDKLKKQKQIFPVISIEGYEKETDQRRGQGIFSHIKKILEQLNKNHIIFGVSLTVTRINFKTIFDELFIKECIDRGCKLFFFIDYIAVEEDRDDLVITEEQKKEIGQNVITLKSKYPALFFSFPSGEEDYGGCLAAGRGFLHISSAGDVEPCPFAPYSDVNLNKISLREALYSKLLNAIRENHDKLKETKGGCALWENREWVRGLKGK